MKYFICILLLFSAHASRSKFGTSSKISFRCQVDIFNKLVDPTTYKAYAGDLVNSVMHEQYNNVTDRDLKKLVELDNGKSLFSNALIGGAGYLRWSVIETNDDGIVVDLENIKSPITARTIYSNRAHDHARNMKSIGESDSYLYRIECSKVDTDGKDVKKPTMNKGVATYPN